MNRTIAFAAIAAVSLTASPAYAQASSQQRSSQDPLGAILGTLFGGQSGSTDSLEAQWAAGQTPLANQRAQFEGRVDSAVRGGTLKQDTATRVKSDYGALVQLETRYGADRRFTTAERTELADRYGELTQVLADGAYAGTPAISGIGTPTPSAGPPPTPEVANGRAEFEQRVNAAVTARRITRTQGTSLKTEYAAVVQSETEYLRDGVISTAERDDLDRRLDDLDARLGDTNYAAAPVLTPRQRLDAIARALPTSGLTGTEQAQLKVEQEDLSRLEAAYARITPSADERAYLERRVGELETRARIRR